MVILLRGALGGALRPRRGRGSTAGGNRGPRARRRQRGWPASDGAGPSPGPGAAQITPRDAGRLLYHTLPWASRAQQEHDALASALREHGVEVLYVTELLQDALEYQ